MTTNPTLPERIDALLWECGRMSFYDLAMALYPDRKSWRCQANGGPPGCYMALSAGQISCRLERRRAGSAHGIRAILTAGDTVTTPDLSPASRRKSPTRRN